MNKARKATTSKVIPAPRAETWNDPRTLAARIIDVDGLRREALAAAEEASLAFDEIILPDWDVVDENALERCRNALLHSRATLKAMENEIAEIALGVSPAPSSETRIRATEEA